MSGLLQRRKLAMIYRLWDPQARGCVNRAAIAAVLEFYYRQVGHLSIGALSHRQ